MSISKRKNEPSHYLLKIESFSLFSEAATTKSNQMFLKPAVINDIENGNRTRFNEKKKEWGFDELISLESFKKVENGYVENDSCVFGAEVFAVTEYAQRDRCLSIIKPPSAVNTHTWKIDNYSDVTETVLQSQVFKVGKVKWKLLIYPKGEEVDEQLSFFLEIQNAALPDGWRVSVALPKDGNIPGDSGWYPSLLGFESKGVPKAGPVINSTAPA
ncbi:hypothetical protein OSB04_016007 [Centaurea solstitialis]|uniref:MATH domain-containing protein n=1 Tax=Centaurea solstitialis TaxID=347529 RepID=A0AA38W820_9ASTR|nr:hypothetical protein OSB04_016007 [Centaurea solstitialis]